MFIIPCDLVQQPGIGWCHPQHSIHEELYITIFICVDRYNTCTKWLNSRKLEANSSIGYHRFCKNQSSNGKWNNQYFPLQQHYNSINNSFWRRIILCKSENGPQHQHFQTQWLLWGKDTKHKWKILTRCNHDVGSCTDLSPDCNISSKANSFYKCAWY